MHGRLSFSSEDDAREAPFLTPAASESIARGSRPRQRRGAGAMLPLIRWKGGGSRQSLCLTAARLVGRCQHGVRLVQQAPAGGYPFVGPVLRVGIERRTSASVAPLAAAGANVEARMHGPCPPAVASSYSWATERPMVARDRSPGRPP